MHEKPAKRILLIDDEPANAEAIQMNVAAFVSGPWEFDWASTYASGLKKLCTGRYSVCLLDNQLREERDGLHLLREAQAMLCFTPVIFLTGDDRRELHEERELTNEVDVRRGDALRVLVAELG